jgi:hemoglobin
VTSEPAAAGADDATSVFEAAGGMPFFERLVDGFYDRVATDEVLLRLYPERDDLGPARRRLTLFLAQYWGGPTTYSAERGHPRLRARHFEFPIGPEERDHWLEAMRASLAVTAAELGTPPVVVERIDGYLAMAAEAMRNRS